VQAALADFDRDIVWVLAATAFAWVGGAVQVFESLRLTYRDGIPGFPIAYYCIIFAHDGSFALNHDHWFNDVHHWYFTNIWYGYVFFALIEVGAILWLVPLAYKELAPPISAGAFYLIYAIFQAAAFALFHLLESAVGDPLNIFGLIPAQVISIVFMIPFLLRRGNTRGQSRLMAWALLLGPGSFGMMQSAAMLPALRTPLYYGMVACMTALSVAYLVLFEFYRRRETAATGSFGFSTRAAVAK
jgi:hypothetical protein